MSFSQNLKNRLKAALGSAGASTEFTAIFDATAGTGAAGKVMSLDSSGDYFGPTTGTYVFGHTSTLTISNGDGATNLIPQHQIVGTGKAGASMLLASFNTTNDATVSPSLSFLKGGNAAIGSNTIVATGEVLGDITWFVDDGADYEAAAARIHAIALATQGAGDAPGAIVFSATTDGGETLAEVGRVSVASGLTLGVAATSLGKLTLSGNTAGTVTVNTAATAGDWTLTLPADDGDAGEQLQTNGSGVTTWEAAGSSRAVKEVVEDLSSRASEALQRIKERAVYAFHYKPDARKEAGLPALSDTQTEFHGVMAEEYPEVMMWGGKIFSPISAFGEAMLAIKALTAEVESLKAAKAPKTRLA